eukprot:4953959-Prymnesium_polylepis.2
MYNARDYAIARRAVRRVGRCKKPRFSLSDGVGQTPADASNLQLNPDPGRPASVPPRTTQPPQGACMSQAGQTYTSSTSGNRQR